MSALELVSGQVTKVLKYSFALDDGEAISISKFADPKPALPALGARVLVGLDSSGFARTIDAAGLSVVPAGDPATRSLGSRSASNGATTPSDPMPPHVLGARAAAQHSAEVSRGVGRDTIITRLAVLKSASHIAAARPTMDRAAMLELATEMESWVGRPS